MQSRPDPISHLFSARRVARRRLLGHLVQARDHERQRIASDLHDVPLQAMSAACSRLQRVRARINDPQLGYDLAQAEASLQEAIEYLRDLTFDLGLGGSDADGIVGDLRTLLVKLGDETDVEFGLSDRVAKEPSPEVAAAAYRIAREALLNVERHSYASRVDVAIDSDDGLYMRIEDDGHGFDPERTQPEPGHMGTAMMRQRAEAAGGWLVVQSAPGKGTVVECFLPEPHSA